MGHSSETGGASVDGGADAVLEAGFEQLFDRSFAGVVGLLRRAIDPHRVDPGSLEVATAVAVEVFARAKRCDDSDRSVTRIVGRALDRVLERFGSSEHACPLPADIGPSDLLDVDVVTPDLVLEWTTAGIPAAEVYGALLDVDRRARRVGLACLGAGLTLEDTAALLDLRGDVALDALAEVAERLTHRRRERERAAFAAAAAASPPGGGST